MIPFGKILQFRYYDAATLERMKNDLALAAPLSFWTYCKNTTLTAQDETLT